MPISRFFSYPNLARRQFRSYFPARIWHGANFALIFLLEFGMAPISSLNSTPYFKWIGPPGPTGSPVKYQTINRIVQNILNATENGINAAINVPRPISFT